jgi:hypothetical protein
MKRYYRILTCNVQVIRFSMKHREAESASGFNVGRTFYIIYLFYYFLCIIVLFYYVCIPSLIQSVIYLPILLLYTYVILLFCLIIARALGVSGRVALLLLLRLPAANTKNLYLVTQVFVCSVWLHGDQPGCLSVM